MDQGRWKDRLVKGRCTPGVGTRKARGRARGNADRWYACGYDGTCRRAHDPGDDNSRLRLFLLFIFLVLAAAFFFFFHSSFSPSLLLRFTSLYFAALDHTSRSIKASETIRRLLGLPHRQQGTIRSIIAPFSSFYSVHGFTPNRNAPGVKSCPPSVHQSCCQALAAVYEPKA